MMMDKTYSKLTILDNFLASYVATSIDLATHYCSATITSYVVMKVQC